MKKIVVTLLMFLTLVCAVDYKQEINQKKKELDAIYSKLDKQRNIINKTKRQSEEVLKAIQTINQVLSKQSNQLEDINLNIKSIKQETVWIGQEIEQEKKKFHQVLSSLSNKYATYYRLGNANVLELVMDSEEFTDYLNKMHFLELVVSRDVEFLESIQERNVRLQKKEINLKDKLDTLHSRQEMIGKLKKEILVNKRQKKRLLQSLQSQRKVYEKRMRDLQKNSLDIERLVIKLQKNSSNFDRIGEGAFIWPLVGRITSRYEMRVHPIFKVKAFHSGLDIGAPEGRPVFASDSGVVIYSGVWGGYGKTVIVDHGGNLTTLYAHLSAFYVKRSVKVTKGQIIGLVGATGYATGPHLHFEVRVSGKTKNPIFYLPKI
jgi:murein DD-endopeptidase MepM/ murein hydrolase activator NlpD